MRSLIRLVRRAKAANRRLRKWGAWVWQRVTGEPGYVEALASLTLAVAELLIRGNRARQALIAAAHIAVVIVHTVERRNGEGDPQQVWA
jgi:energy-converting hydrogenase Eha subunit B